MHTPDTALAGASPETTHVYAQPAPHPPRVVAAIDVVSATIPGLAPHESAHQIAGGPTFVVALHRVPADVQGWHVVEARAREVDPMTGAPIGEPLPAERVSLPVAMVSAGVITLAGIRDEQAHRAAERLLHHRRHADEFAALPLLTGAP